MCQTKEKRTSSILGAFEHSIFSAIQKRARCCSLIFLIKAEFETNKFGVLRVCFHVLSSAFEIVNTTTLTLVVTRYRGQRIQSGYRIFWKHIKDSFDRVFTLQYYTLKMQYFCNNLVVGCEQKTNVEYMWHYSHRSVLSVSASLTNDYIVTAILLSS